MHKCATLRHSVKSVTNIAKLKKYHFIIIINAVVVDLPSSERKKNNIETHLWAHAAKE